MSNATPQEEEPLWADSNIHNALYPHVKNIGYTDWVHLSDAQFIAQLVRDSYEATIATQAARLLELERERDDLAARVNDGEAIEMLRWIVDAYHPQWHYEMGKTGYECAFCKSMFKTSKEFQDTASHKLGCQWARTKAWLESVKEQVTR